MQVLPVFYTQRWMAVTISLVLGLGPGLAMCKLICTLTFHITLIQQQGYQHARLVNLCLVRYNLRRFDTAVRTYNCSPCSKCFIPFHEMATAVEWNSLFPRSYMQYSTELQKLIVTFNQSNEVLFVRLCYSKLQSHLVPQSQRTST